MRHHKVYRQFYASYPAAFSNILRVALAGVMLIIKSLTVQIIGFSTCPIRPIFRDCSVIHFVRGILSVS